MKFEDNQSGLAVEGETYAGELSSEYPKHKQSEELDVTISQIRDEILVAEKEHNEAEVLRLEQVLHDTEKQKKEMQEHVEYELARLQVFRYIEPLKKKVSQLTQLVKEVENSNKPSDEEIYTERLAALREKEELLANVTRFETTLWGNSPTEHKKSVHELNSEMKAIEDPQGVLALFDKWGALPGVNDMDRPIADRSRIEQFLEKDLIELPPQAAHEMVKKVFANPVLQKKVLSFLPPVPKSTENKVENWNEEESAPQLEYAPDVAVFEDGVLAKRERNPGEFSPKMAKEWEETPGKERVERYQLDVDSLRKKIDLAEKRDDEQAVLEYEAKLREVEKDLNASKKKKVETLESLQAEEGQLLKAREILSSRLYKISPFLLKLTRSGREKLALLKNMGLSDEAPGSSKGSKQIALAFKMKALKEKRSSINGSVKQSFVDDIPTRLWSEERMKPGSGSHPDDIREYSTIKQELRAKSTKSRNVRNINRALGVKKKK
jgi:hypothetical protein